MKPKYTLTIFLITVAMNMNLAYAQTTDEFWAEEFLAEVFFGNMNEESPKIYAKQTSFNPMFDLSFYKPAFYKSTLYTKFCKQLNLCDSAVVNEMYEYDVLHFADNKPITWNENAPIFQQPKYKNLIFVDDWSKISKKERKKWGNARSIADYISKPLFTKNGDYALIAVHHNHYYTIGRERDIVVPDDIVLYKRIDNKWVELGRFKDLFWMTGK